MSLAYLGDGVPSLTHFFKVCWETAKRKKIATFPCSWVNSASSLSSWEIIQLWSEVTKPSLQGAVLCLVVEKQAVLSWAQHNSWAFRAGSCPAVDIMNVDRFVPMQVFTRSLYSSHSLTIFKWKITVFSYCVCKYLNLYLFYIFCLAPLSCMWCCMS